MSTSKRQKSSWRTYLAWPFAKIAQFWAWYRGLYRGAPWYKKLWLSLVSFVAGIVFYFLAVYFNLFWLFGKSPSMSDIMEARNNEASMLYSADSVLLGKYFNENRSPVAYEEVNPMFYKTLIATEDVRFYEHSGIDFQGLLSAVKDMAQGNARGASTITQQLVKNMFRVRTKYSAGLLGKIPGVKMLVMKSKEWMLAVQIEMFYSKEEILAMYVNTVDFGSNAYGIKTASKTYFDTTPDRLTVEQGATLVGLLKATTSYNPKINPERSRRRRNVVIDLLAEQKHLSRQEADSIKALPTELNFSVETAYDGKALYFRDAVANHLDAWCKDNGYDLYSDGLKIYTTLDSRMQAYAEDAVRKHMRQVQQNFKSHWGSQDPWDEAFLADLVRRTPAFLSYRAKHPEATEASIIDSLRKDVHTVRVFDYDAPSGYKEMLLSTVDSVRYMTRFMHTSLVAMDAQTSHIKAYVGDIDFAHWKYDKAAATHQPGSTFKLFVYTEAMNQGMTACDTEEDSYIEMTVKTRDGRDTIWRPRNANGRFSGANMPLRAAFARSVNTVAVRLGQRVGMHNVMATAERMGIQSPLENNPSLALGSSDVNVVELVNAYATVANQGRHNAPVFVTRILDREGNEIYTAPDTEQQAIPERSAFLMQQLLMAGMRDGGGTSQSLWGYVGNHAAGTDFGGKTGTTNGNADGWFVGVSPKLVAAAWVGGEYRNIHFRTGALGQGSRTALPIVGYFLGSVFNDAHLAPTYRGHWPKQVEGVSPADYQCSYHVPVQDTVSLDSLSLFLDELNEIEEDPDAVPTTDLPQEAGTSLPTAPPPTAEP